MDSNKSEGLRVGAYRVVRSLAIGGTSDVLLAEKDGNQVVLKRLFAQHAKSRELTSMFAREVAAYSRLSDPSIVRLFEFFTDDEGRPVMVLDHVDGPPLRKLRGMLRGMGQVLNDQACLHVAAHVFEALACAHGALDESGAPSPVIHRDVNPSNVLVGWDGRVQLADFGVARVTGVNHESQAGVLRGTYGYMAPEQIAGTNVTPRVDVYAAAVIVWEMLTRRRAFQRGALPEAEVLRQMAEPRLTSLDVLRPDVDKTVREAIHRALEPNPQKRTVTAEEIASILRAVVTPEAGKAKLVAALATVRHEPKPASTVPPLGLASDDATTRVLPGTNATNATPGTPAARKTPPPMPAVKAPPRPRASTGNVTAVKAPTPPAPAVASRPASMTPEVGVFDSLVVPPVSRSESKHDLGDVEARAARESIEDILKDVPATAPGPVFDAAEEPTRERALGELPPAPAAMYAERPTVPNVIPQEMPVPGLPTEVAAAPMPAVAPMADGRWSFAGDAQNAQLVSGHWAMGGAPTPMPPLDLEQARASAQQAELPSRDEGLAPVARPSRARGPWVFVLAGMTVCSVAFAGAGAMRYMRMKRLQAQANVAPTTSADAGSSPFVTAVGVTSASSSAVIEPSADAGSSPFVTAVGATSPSSSAAIEPSAVPVALAASTTPAAIVLDATTASAAKPDVPPGMGVIKTEGALSGRRIFVDERTVGQTPSAVTVKCGAHAVKIGSSGRVRTVDVPCGGSVSVVEK